MHQERQGELFILAGASLWGLFPIITILSLNRLEPLTSLAWSTLCATVFFAIMISFRKRWREITNPTALKFILLNALFIGVLLYGFIFYGLQNTSAGNAAIIGQTEVFFSYIFFHLWRRDFIPPAHIIGAVLVLLGAVIVLSPSFTNLQIGDLFILIGLFFAPFGNFFQQRARKLVSSETIMFGRSAISVPVLFVGALLLGEHSGSTDLKYSFVYIGINGLFLLGLSKIFWIEAIHRISVTKANALSCINPLFTLFFAWLILHDTPTSWQLLSFIPMSVGVLLLGTKTRDSGRP